MSAHGAADIVPHRIAVPDARYREDKEHTHAEGGFAAIRKVGRSDVGDRDYCG
mgnify:CR=1 FL=1